MPAAKHKHHAPANAYCGGVSRGVQEELEAMARKAGVKARELVDAARGDAADIMPAIEESIKENPLQIGLAALAFGFVTGLILRRR